jgi:hypothetical protein
MWMKGRGRGGYGKFAAGGGRTVAAHRWAYEHFIGPIPERHEVCHSCDNPPCCELSHLFLGTHKANIDDKMAKGRDRGNPNPGQKLSDKDVSDIRALAAAGVTQARLASVYGVTPTWLNRIVTGKRR